MSISTVCRLLVGLVSIYFTLPAFSQSVLPDSIQLDTTFRRIAEDERKRLIDPATGTVPYERLEEARRQLTERQSETNASIPNVIWQERGPSNAGGRTRAILFDPNDPARKKVWAGSVRGGLWYTNDITDVNATWTPVSDFWENRVISALAADPSNPQIMYAGTGDRYDYLSGSGIWKTTNGGTTWTRLSSTIPSGNAPSVNRALEFIQRIVVNSSGHVFAATQYGVVKSTDGGNSWSYALAPGQLIGVGGNTSDYYYDNVTDLEIGKDGILFAAFNPSRVFKSTDASGNTWQEITPPGGTGSERTELALAPSSSGTLQVIYAVSRAYNATNYSQDIRWFKKSTNGGVTWSDVSIPLDYSSRHFTAGNGYYSMGLAVSPANSNIVFAGGVDWYRSTDGGATWTSALTYTYSEHSLIFQPGTPTAVVFSNEYGVYWSADMGGATQSPSIVDRRNGYRAAEVNSVAMKASAGNNYMLASARPLGVFTMSGAGLSASPNFFYRTTAELGLTFIDEDEPNIQLFTTYGNSNLYNGSTYSTVLTTNAQSATNPAEYDSQSNTLYVPYYTSGEYYIRRGTGIGSGSVVVTNMLLLGIGYSQTVFKLGRDRTTMFIGTSNGEVYKITGLNQSYVSVSPCSNNAFPRYTSISSIDIGATDNELLVTLSNYGVQSVWYTNDGGTTWTGKDQSNYGLPDMPVRQALFNPQNRKQVFLATELGIWSTTDITATNPGWTFTSSGLGATRVNQLRYRASDGLLTAATAGRGIWSSDALAIPYTAPAIAISNISSTTLCAGNTFTVSFTQSGPAMGSNNTYEVWLSDASGSFATRRRLGSGTASPIIATLPTNSNIFGVYGTNYRIKVIATNPEVESDQSGPLTIGNLASIFLTDREILYGKNYTGAFICNGSTVTMITVPKDRTNISTSPESYQWFLNGNEIPNVTSATYTTGQAGRYTVTAKQAGCTANSTYEYQLSTNSTVYSNIISHVQNAPQCEDRPLTIASTYVGESATYQWARDGVDIAGATSYSLTINQTGTYTHRFVDRSCSNTSSESFFQFGRALPVRIVLPSPGDTLICSGNSVYLSNAEYVSNSTLSLPDPYTYQWYKNGVAILYATTSYYYVNEPGLYTLAVRQGSCEARSNSILIRSVSTLIPTIEKNSSSSLACSGESRQLTARPYSLSNQWQKDGVDIAGATNSYYNATTSGQYTVRTGTGTCAATSAPVGLTFGNQIQPRIAPINNITENCTNVFLTQNSEYSQSSYQYQWIKDGAVIPGATSSAYSATQTGLYRLSITSGSCQGISKGLFITVGKVSKPIVRVSDAVSICKDRSVPLSAAAASTSPFQWKRNGIPISTPTYNLFYATESGLYSAVIKLSNSCEAESDPVQITIGEPTAARLAGNTLISAGKSAQLPVAFTGVAPWSFTLSNGQSVQNTYQNPYMLTVTPTNTTTYSLASVNNGCGSGSVSGSSTVSVANGSADLAMNMMVNNRTPNVGDVVTYSLILTNEGQNEATGVQVASRLPTGLVFVDALSPGVTFGDGIVRTDAGTVAINGLTRIQFRARVTQPGTFATAAQVTACQTPDLDSQPNSGTGDGEDDAATIDLRTASQSGSLLVSANPDQVVLPKLSGNQPVADANTADLSLTMSTNALSPKAGDVITVMLQVSNRGGSAASSIEVQTQLPASWQLASTDGLVVSGQTIKGYINQLPAGKSATINLSLRVGSTNNVLQSQIADVAESDPDSTPGNGYDKGEDDEASIMVRQR
jgi:uncharacterized repeat protein (TIGR01451 family)